MALTTPAADLSSPEESGVTVKKEKEDEDSCNTRKSTETNGIIINQQASELLPQTPANGVSEQHRTSVLSNSSIQTTKTLEVAKPVKPAPPAIDFASTCGAFGWTTIGSVHLPFIMRGEDRFIAVRMVECKIISSYADVLPWTVFTCTNIKSYYITENEAKLLNEINGFHCEFQFGYHSFTPKDVVVRLKDTIKFYEFLETCKGKLNIPGANPIFNDQCGYFLINYAPVPFVKKGTNKYIPINMVYPEGMTPPMENLQEVTEWDLAYLRFLCSMGNLDPRKVNYEVRLCAVSDLQNVLGGVPFEEWWPNMQYSSKTDSSHLSSSNNILPKWGETFSSMHSSNTPVDSSKKLREKINEIPDKESSLNQLFGLNKFLDMGAPVPKSAQVSRSHHDQQSLLNSFNSIQNGEKAMFPTSLENFLSTSSCNYPYPVNYRHQYNNHMQTSVSEYDRCRRADTPMPNISSNRNKPYPPPPPLVRVGSSRVNSVPGEHNMVPKSAPSIYPYLPNSSNSQCNPWLARILEPDWLQEDNRAVLQTSDGPENLSRRLSETEAWCPTSSINMNGAGSTNVQNTSVIRETYDQNYVSHPHGGSPRLVPGPGPPPHYPTPPQSSPLQPMSLMDCVNMSGITDIYATRSTPNGLLDLCSPPPSPETRTALSSSPRGSHLSSYSYQPHITRLVQVDTRYVVAINIEPHKYNSVLAVPVSDVVNKFLRGTPVQSCQIVLETVFGLHLYECTR